MIKSIKKMKRINVYCLAISLLTLCSVASGAADISVSKSIADLTKAQATDTPTIAAKQDVTIPAGTTVTIAGLTVSSGTAKDYTKLIINGKLSVTGDIKLGSYTGIEMGPGSVLDINGHKVITSGPTQYTFTGTAEKHITLQSTGSPGSFIGGAYQIIAAWDYVDVIGLGDSTFGRTHKLANGFVRFEHCTFTGCARVSLDATGIGDNCGFLISHCDFRDPAADNPEGANDMQPTIYQPKAVGKQQRRVENCTWSQSGKINGVVEFRAQGMTIVDNVFHNFKILSQYKTSHYKRNFFSNNTKPSEFFKASGGLSMYASLTDNYFYYTDGWHPLGHTSTNITVKGNIFDATDGGYGGNWFLWARCKGKITIQRNIFLGKGIPLTFTKPSTPKLDFSFNTILIDNDGKTGSGLAFSTILLTEQSSELSGHIEIYNNLIVDPNSNTKTDVAIDLLTNKPDQISYLGYNVGWTEPAGASTPPVKYNDKVVVTAGVGVNDIAVEPKFEDSKRTMLTWDASLGGPGTAVNAIKSLAARTSGYTPHALVTYIKKGFTPSTNALSGIGRNGANIGAMKFSTKTD